jgi:hypothetical protein
MDKRGLTVVRERSPAPGGGTVNGVIVTNNSGRRFRLLDSAGKLTMVEDTTPREATSTWLRVECPRATLRSTRRRCST